MERRRREMEEEREEEEGKLKREKMRAIEELKKRVRAYLVIFKMNILYKTLTTQCVVQVLYIYNYIYSCTLYLL